MPGRFCRVHEIEASPSRAHGAFVSSSSRRLDSRAPAGGHPRLRFAQPRSRSIFHLMRVALCATPAVALQTLTASADTSVSTVCLPGGSSAVGSYALASVIAEPTACTVQLVGAIECDPGYLGVEPSDFGKVGDINHDGSVNGIDLAYVLGDWGTANPRSDLDHDGLVSGSDLATVLANWG